MKKLLGALLISVGLYGVLQHNPNVLRTSEEKAEDSILPISTACQHQLSGVRVWGSGTVSHILGDDTKGRRHQRFILRLTSGATVLVAHNIDLAPRVDGLRNGDLVEFSGEYEWNEKGGVIHWTHHDPQGKHAGGWIKHNGRKYQ